MATLTAKIVPKSQGDKEKPEIIFERLEENIGDSVGYVSTYTPVDLVTPNYTKFPLLKKATPLTCEIEKVIDTCIY
jgi:hypothetical protein